MTQINTHTDNEIAVVAEARRQVAAGIAPVGLVERAYRVVERYPRDPADDGIVAAAMEAGIIQVCFLEDAEWLDGWSRLKLKHADGREESLDLLVFRQQNPDRLFFDVEVEIAAARIAKALPKSDPRQGEIATLTLARAAVRKTLNRMVGSFKPTTSDDAVAQIHVFGDAWEDHHRLQLIAIAGTPASYASAVSKREAALVDALVGPDEGDPRYTWLSAIVTDLEDRCEDDPAFRETWEREDPLSASEALREGRAVLSAVRNALKVSA